MIPDSTRSSWLHNRWPWFLLLIIPYGISVLWLNVIAFAVPIVVVLAPLGFVKLAGNPIHYAPILWLSHLVFWPLYLTALIGAKRISTSILRTIFLVLAAAIVCTCYGCATYHVDPLRNWKDLGMLKNASPPEAIKQDAQAFFQTLPEADRPGEAQDIDVTYWVNGNGQHAVVLDDPHEGEDWHYALIYDRDNRRIKVLRYSTNMSGITDIPRYSSGRLASAPVPNLYL